MKKIRKTVVYSGSFNPITHGHLWVIEKAHSLFDEIVILIGTNPSKKSYFSDEERLNLIKCSVAHLPNVKVKVLGSEYVASFCKREKIDYQIRGIRNWQDLEYERTILRTNERINSDLQTFFLLPPENLSELSSSLIKSLVGFPNWQETIEPMVPECVIRAFLKKICFDRLESYWTLLFGGKYKEWLNSLVELYSDPRRYYHTGQHILELLEQSPLSSKNTMFINDTSTEENFIVTFAIWFHDAIYDPKAKDNEENSEELWRKFAEEIAVDKKTREEVSKIILATKNHTKAPSSKTVDLFLDLDLSILGADEVRFLEYEKQIGKEYSFVPSEIFQRERGKILKQFLDAPKLFRTKAGQDQFEEKAKANLKKLLELVY